MKKRRPVGRARGLASVAQVEQMQVMTGARFSLPERAWEHGFQGTNKGTALAPLALDLKKIGKKLWITAPPLYMYVHVYCIVKYDTLERANFTKKIKVGLKCQKMGVFLILKQKTLK